jgi:hypothetical protein
LHSERVEKHHSAVVAPVNSACQPLLKRSVGISFLDADVPRRLVFGFQRLQLADALWITLDKNIRAERIHDVERDPWRALEEFGFGLVGFRVGTKQTRRLIGLFLGPDPRQSRSRERVNENRAAQPVALLFQDGGVKTEILPERTELFFGPRSDSAILGLLRHSAATP